MADDGWFFVGGRYVALAEGAHMASVMYVKRYAPADKSGPCTVVMILGPGRRLHRV